MRLIRLPGPDGGLLELDYDALEKDEREAVDPLLADYEQVCDRNPLWAFTPFGAKGGQSGAQVAFLNAGRTKIKMGTAGN